MTTRHWPFFIFVAVLVSAALVQGYLSSAPAEGPVPEELPQEGSREGSQEVPDVESVGQRQVIMPTRLHIPDDRFATYNTVPPTSGNHRAGWASCGFYQEGLPDELIVHNLEHSIIVISYNLTSQAEVNNLRSVVNSIPQYRTWGLSRYYDRIPKGTIALAAWGVLDTMDQTDRDRIQRFFDEFAGNEGVERIPCEIDPSRMRF